MKDNNDRFVYTGDEGLSLISKETKESEEDKTQEEKEIKKGYEQYL